MLIGTAAYVEPLFVEYPHELSASAPVVFVALMVFVKLSPFVAVRVKAFEAPDIFMVMVAPESQVFETVKLFVPV